MLIVHLFMIIKNLDYCLLNSHTTLIMSRILTFATTNIPASVWLTPGPSWEYILTLQYWHSTGSQSSPRRKHHPGICIQSLHFHTHPRPRRGTSKGDPPCRRHRDGFSRSEWCRDPPIFPPIPCRKGYKGQNHKDVVCCARQPVSCPVYDCFASQHEEIALGRDPCGSPGKPHSGTAWSLWWWEYLVEVAGAIQIRLGNLEFNF